ncbi:hypothetical protein [Nostoc phage Nsp-JY10]
MIQYDQPEPHLSQLVPYCVGFLTSGRDEYGNGLVPCGSGVFIEVNGWKGVLTAAHVLEALEQSDRCGLMLFNEKARKAPNLEFNGNSILRSKKIGPSGTAEGPDLAVFQLPSDIEGWVASKALFYNFDKRLELASEEGPSLPYEILVGMMKERSENKSVGDDRRTDTHSLSLVYGDAEAYKPTEIADLFDFRCNHSEDVPAPRESYGGFSGSPIWMVATEPGVNNFFLKGIAFFESDVKDDGSRHLVCHGPSSVWKLVPLMVQDLKG